VSLSGTVMYVSKPSEYKLFSMATYPDAYRILRPTKSQPFASFVRNSDMTSNGYVALYLGKNLRIDNNTTGILHLENVALNPSH
jgi:hypothetical protein